MNPPKAQPPPTPRNNPAGGAAPPRGATTGTSLSLLMRLRMSDPTAWQQLVYLYQPVVLGWLKRCKLQAADAEDACQEVFQTVVRRIQEFRREQASDSFRGWLFTITRNKARDFWRRRTQQQPADGGTGHWMRLAQVPDELDDEAGELAPPEQFGLFRRGLELVKAEFNDRVWQAFWRVTVEDSPAAEVAAALAMTTNAVYVAKSRVLARLREELGELMETPTENG